MAPPHKWRNYTVPLEPLVADIVPRVVATAQPDKVILFGSRARGKARPESDFDLLVIKASDAPGYRRDAALYLALAGLNAPVDLITYTHEQVRDWSAVPQALVTTANREGKVVYEKEG
jgi:predicted nucleotidyltransferase